MIFFFILGVESMFWICDCATEWRVVVDKWRIFETEFVKTIKWMARIRMVIKNLRQLETSTDPEIVN